MKNLWKEYKTAIVLTIALVLVGLPVLAGGSLGSFKAAVVDKIADKWLAENVDDSANFGAITTDKSTFDHGIEIPDGGLDVTGGAVDISATSTISRPDATYIFDMNFQAGTSTSQVSSENTESYLGGVQNTGNDLLCSAVWSDISTANNVFAYDIKVGEASSATSSATLINATTGGHEIGTTTTDVLSKQDDEGSNADEYFIWEGGNHITATQVFVKANATSSASFTAEGGNTGDGTVHINCRNRY